MKRPEDPTGNEGTDVIWRGATEPNTPSHHHTSTHQTCGEERLETENMFALALPPTAHARALAQPRTYCALSSGPSRRATELRIAAWAAGIPPTSIHHQQEMYLSWNAELVHLPTLPYLPTR